MNNNQTAVDFLMDQLKFINKEAYAHLSGGRERKAKAIEKKRMLEFASKVLYKAECSFTGTAYLEKDMEEFYNETYGK